MDSAVFSGFVDSVAAKQYAALYRPLAERICAEEYPKYKNERDRIKAARSRLHVLYGAYSEHTVHSKAQKLLQQAVEGLSRTEPGGEGLSGTGEGVPKGKPRDEGWGRAGEGPTVLQKDSGRFSTFADTAEAVMRLHTSTRERLPYLRAFYDFIFSGAAPVRSVLDIGCGLNPFAIPFMRGAMATLALYYACDIDTQAAALINQWFSLLGLPEEGFCADIIVETPSCAADLALLLKLLPLLEGQRKGRGYQLIQQLRAKRIVVSYPLRSMGGRKRGMDTHYAQVFRAALNGPLAGFAVEREAAIANERVYVLRR